MTESYGANVTIIILAVIAALQAIGVEIARRGKNNAKAAANRIESELVPLAKETHIAVNTNHQHMMAMLEKATQALEEANQQISQLRSRRR